MKRTAYILFLVVLSLLPFLPMFVMPGIFHTSDGEVQLPRMGAFYKAVMDGHLPVRWAGDLNYGYGMPLFVFIYHLPFWVSTVVLRLGGSFESAFEIVLFIPFILSGIGMYLFSCRYFNSDRTAFLVSLLYQFAPYRFVESHIRGSIGSTFAYAFLPFVLLGITDSLRKPGGTGFFVTAIATAFMVLSHNSLSLVFFGLAVAFMVWERPGRKMFGAASGLGLGLGLSAYFWLPAILEHKYTYGDLFMKDMFRSHFPPMTHFVIPNLLYWKQFLTAEIPVHIGIVHTAFLFLGLFLLIRTKHNGQQSQHPLVSYAVVVTAATFFVMTPVSQLLWENIPLLRQFQFPWRLLSVIVVTTSLLGSAGASTTLLRRNVFYFLAVLLCVLPTVRYWFPVQGIDRIDDRKVWDYPLNTTYFGETDVIWSAGPAGSYPPQPVTVIEGAATVDAFEKRTHVHTYTITATTPVRIVDHTQYFPGWRVYLDGTKIPIEFQDVNWRGLLTYGIPEGQHNVRVVFSESKVRLMANTLTLMSVAIMLTIFVRMRLSLNRQSSETDNSGQIRRIRQVRKMP